MNLINLSYEEIKTDSKTGKNPTSKMLKDSKLNALKYFLNYRQDITSNKKIYISLSSYNDYLLYEEIIPLVKNFKECKYYLHIAQTNLKNFINKEVTMVNLFKQIPYVKCVGKPSESLLGKNSQLWENSKGRNWRERNRKGGKRTKGIGRGRKQRNTPS